MMQLDIIQKGLRFLIKIVAFAINWSYKPDFMSQQILVSVCPIKDAVSMWYTPPQANAWIRIHNFSPFALSLTYFSINLGTGSTPQELTLRKREDLPACGYKDYFLEHSLTADQVRLGADMQPTITYDIELKGKFWPSIIKNGFIDNFPYRIVNASKENSMEK